MKKILLASALALTPILAFADTSTSTVTTTATGTTQTGVVHPPMWSGAMMEQETKGLILAMGQLAPADRATLVKMIKDYLVSKGIDPAKYAEKRDEIKEVRKETRVEIKETRKATEEELKNARKKLQEAAKAKREEMREKIKSIRGN